MGLFGGNGICSICNTGEGSKKLLDGYICKECMCKTYPYTITPWKNVSVEKIIKIINIAEKNNHLTQIFQPTKKNEKYIRFDENNKLWKVKTLLTVFEYSDIVSYELLEDGESITKGGLGRAVTGGVLFGGVGAIVGGVTGKKKTKKEINEFRIKIITKHEMNPEIYINFLTAGSVKTGSILYKSYKGAAERIITELTIITDSLKVNQNNENIGVSYEADEILKYKKLCDDGIITEEEFQAKKRQLLGL